MKMTKANGEPEVLKVKATTNPSKLASAIVRSIQNNEDCEIMAIGAGPINQAVKAVAISNRLLGSSGISLSIKPCFTTLDLSKETRTDSTEPGKSEVTAIKFKVMVDK
jgi:stage V sporulation protein S